jgi:hypothetical protein
MILRYMLYQRHNVEEIEGIGSAYGGEMKNHGISKTEDLLVHSELRLNRTLGKISGFPTSKIKEFQAHAQLLEVSGMTGQYAEAFYRSGRHNLLKLAAPDPSVLVDEIDKAVKDSIIPEGIDLQTATKFQKRALKIAYSGKVFGLVESGTGPISGAIIYYNDETAVSDENGYFWLPVVSFGSVKLIIRTEGYHRLIRKLTLSPNVLSFNKIKLSEGNDEEETVDESAGDLIRHIDADDEIVFEDVSLEDLPNGSPLQLRHRYEDNKVRLIGVYRTRVGNKIKVKRLKIDGNLIDIDSSIEQIYIWQDGKLNKSSESIRDIRKNLFFKKFTDQKVEINPMSGVDF